MLRCRWERFDEDLQPFGAAGFQEMWPASVLAQASGGDALTGINRADSASVKSVDECCSSQALLASPMRLRQRLCVSKCALC